MPSRCGAIGSCSLFIILNREMKQSRARDYEVYECSKKRGVTCQVRFEVIVTRGIA